MTLPPREGFTFGGFEAVARSTRGAGAAVYTGRRVDQESSEASRARLVVLPGFTRHEDPAARRARAGRYAAGIGELAPVLTAGRMPRAGAAAPPLETAPSSNRELWVVAFRAISAETVDDALSSGVRMSPELAATVVERIGAALGPLHDQGVVHGHLRADLIAVSAGELGVVEGFGLAQLGMSVSPQYARDILPPEYRAPELRGASPARPTPWSEMYAFGVLTWEMVAARRAGTEQTPASAEPGRVRDPRLSRLLAAAVADSSAGRPSDARAWAGEVAAVLRTLAADEPVPLRAPDPPPDGPVTAAVLSAVADPSVGAPEVGVAAPSSEKSATGPAPPGEQPAAPPPGAPQVPFAPPGVGTPAQQPGRTSSTGLWVVLCIVLGALLMCGGVGGLFAYRVISSKRLSFPASSSSPVVVTPRIPPSTSGPPPVAPPPQTDPDPTERPFDPETAGDAGPESALEPEPEGQRKHLPDDKRALRVHPDDALAPLPVDAAVPVLGRRSAPVTWVVFGDLECPYTRRLLRNLLRLERQMPAELRLAWRHRPLAEHAHARVAADFAATLQQGAGDDAFWRFVGQIAAAEQPPAVPALRAWLEQAGIEGTQWQKWLASPAASEHVERDLRLAGQFNVRSTPTSFVNGVRVEGSRPYAELRQIFDQERRAALAALASGAEPSKLYLTRTKKNLINLGPDVVMRACPKPGKSPARGAKDALVTIVEFADFECEYCKRAQPTLRALLARYPQTLRIVWKNFPLEQHARARAAAALAMEVHEQRGERHFWQVHDLLFKAAPDLSEAALLDVARGAALSADDARQTLRNAERAPVVLRDVALGEKLSVSGTPTFFVNGRRIAGARPLHEFRALVDEELKIAQRLLESGTAREDVYRTLCGGP